MKDHRTSDPKACADCGATGKRLVSGHCFDRGECAKRARHRPSEARVADVWNAAIEACARIADEESERCRAQKESVPSPDKLVHAGGQYLANTIAARIRGIRR